MMLPDRIFDDMFDFGEPRSHGPKDRMDCDIYEKDGNYVVEASAFGFDKEDIKVEAEDGSIIITASKEENETDNNKNYLRRERHFHSKIQRAFYLGDIDEDNIKASFDNGLLKIEVPKKAIESNRKYIDIE